MIVKWVRQLMHTKLNILCKVERNSLPKESRYSKIPRNKLIFSGLNWDFGLYPLKFCSKGNLRDREAKFFLFGVFDPDQNLVPRKWSQNLRNFPLLIATFKNPTVMNTIIYVVIHDSVAQWFNDSSLSYFALWKKGSLLINYSSQNKEGAETLRFSI